MTSDQTKTPAIIPREHSDIVLLFKNGGAEIDPLIERIEIEVRSHAPDLTSKKGRDAIASLAHKVSKSKTALDAAGKSLTENQKAEIKQVDGARKKIRDRLDALRDEARKPLTDWEAAEAEKAARVEATMSDLRNHGLSGSETPQEIKAAADLITSISLVGIEGPALDMANEVRTHTLAALRTMYSAAVQRDADAAELVALRAAQQAQIEREQEAAIEAARIAQIEADKLAAAQAEIDAIKAEAARKAVMAQEAEWAKENEAKRLAQIEADKAAAVEAAKKDAEDRHAREMQKANDAKVAADKALQDEANEREAEQKKRANDQSHRDNIHAAISAALLKMKCNASPDEIATALMDGDIPYTKVTL